MSKTLFEKIIDREIPGDIIFEDDKCIAFRDINPGAPMHVLVVPRRVIPRLVDAMPEDQALLGHLLLVCNKVAEQEGQGEAFRVAINNGAGAGQSVFHLHFHVLGGRSMKWPPG